MHSRIYFQVYDCKLERSAKKWAKKCIWDHSHWKGANGHSLGENLHAGRKWKIVNGVEQKHTQQPLGSSTVNRLSLGRLIWLSQLQRT